MKKLVLLLSVICSFYSVFAGGILTNGNQSAQYLRMLSRNASTSIDAVYYNPAGLIKMENGFYISIQNQSLFQTRTVESSYTSLNQSSFDGTLTAPVFPSAYAVYKRDKWAFSFGFAPNSGGGSVEFENGIPYFEKDISSLVPKLAGLSKLGKNVSDYKVDIYFNGKSVYWGFQGGVSYKVNEIFSVYGGLRYIPASTKYDGYLKNIELNVNGQFKNASSFLGGEVAPIFTTLANNATGAATNVQSLVTAGAGALNLTQVQEAGYIDGAAKTQLVNGLLGLGVPQAQVDQMTMTQMQTAFTSGAVALNGQAATMTATGNALQDKLVDVEQTGTAYTPVLGLSISPIEGLNIGMKYEFRTKLDLTNATVIDGTGKFPDKKVTGSDLPSLFTVGVGYKMNKKLDLSLSFNSTRDKGVDWGVNVFGENRTIDRNSWEFAVGGQYQLLDKWAVSAGYLHTVMGTSAQFQSDFSYYNSGESLAGGFEFKPTPRFTIDAGMICTIYQDAHKALVDPIFGAYSETYKKNNIGYALSLGYRFGGLD